MEKILFIDPIFGISGDIRVENVRHGIGAYKTGRSDARRHI
jgi:hypothetical protein